jgi:cytochrome c556
MRRVAQQFVLAGFIGCLGFFSLAVMAAEKKEPLSIEEIMSKGHSGKKSLLNKIKDGLKSEKWEAIAEPAKEFKSFGEDLGKNKPPRGDMASWKKLSEEYKSTTAAIATAVEKKDAKAANDAVAKMGKSCKTCHDSHK